MFQRDVLLQCFQGQMVAIIPSLDLVVRMGLKEDLNLTLTEC
jgi:hypothetical protein